MNNTHYVLIDKENEVIAVLLKDNFKGRAIKAIEDETGDEIKDISFEQIEHNSYKVTAFLNDSEYNAILRPTWEY